VKSHPYKLVKAYTLMHFITCILLSAKLIILSYKTGIIISSYALILCVGVTSSSECHASPPLFVASRAQMGNGRCSWAIGMHQLKQNRLPHFSLFFFYAAFFFFFLLANCLEQTFLLNDMKKIVFWLSTWISSFFADVSVFLYLFGMARFYCERDTLSFAVPLFVFFHVLTFKWLKMERSGE